MSFFIEASNAAGSLIEVDLVLNHASEDHIDRQVLVTSTEIMASVH